MIKRGAMLAVLLGLAAAGFLLFRALWPNEEAVIRRTWQEVLEKGRKSSAQSLLGSARRATELLAYFTTGAVIEVGAPYPMTLSRGQLPGILHQVWSHAERLTLRDRGIDISVAPDRASATLEVTLELEAVVRGDAQSGLDAYRIHWQKAEGDWRIHRVQRLETIQNPAGPSAQ